MVLKSFHTLVLTRMWTELLSMFFYSDFKIFKK